MYVQTCTLLERVSLRLLDVELEPSWICEVIKHNIPRVADQFRIGVPLEHTHQARGLFPDRTCTLFLVHCPGPGIVLHGHAHFRKGGKGSGDSPYSQLFRHTVECGPITEQHSVT